uniref:Flagellar hook-associated protein 3 n=1 Tax=Desulfatirhabdium butyrativorans TaxID=340467 RepID=A0A7C4RRQ6_9BACT
MRITNTMIGNGVQRHLAKNAESVYRLQETISTGKRVNRPSDDPAAAARIVEYRKALSSIDQYNRNIGNAQTELNLAESHLAEVVEQVTRAKELLLSQVTDTASSDTRKIAAEEIRQIRDAIVQLANAKNGDRYLFGGTESSKPPYDPSSDAPEFQGNDGEFSTMIAPGVTMTTNANGKMAFSRDVDTVKLLTDIMGALQNNDIQTVRDHLAAVDQAMNQASDARADIGVKLGRLDTTSAYWDSVHVNITQSLSNVEDADMTEAIAQLNSWQTAYEASLAVSAKVFQQSLVDFLR